MTPDHREGRAAARRVEQANKDGHVVDDADAMTMLVYYLSLLIRDQPERQRVTKVLEITRQLVSNTRESLD